MKRGLQELANDIENGNFSIEESFEDVHSKIEWELTNKLGEVGKKIHTARSRNDQVLVALQLYYKENLALVNTKVAMVFETLLNLAETHKEQFVAWLYSFASCHALLFWIVVFCLCRIVD